MTTKTPLPRAPRSGLRATDIEGVFINRAKVLVNADGVALNFKDIKKADDDRANEVLGRPVSTVLDVIEAVAMDPRLPMHTRLSAAKDAAPYKHPKLHAIQGVAGAPPIQLGVANMDKATLDAYIEALRAADKVVSGSVGQ